MGDRVSSALAFFQNVDHVGVQEFFWAPIGPTFWAIVAGAAVLGSLMLLRNTANYVSENGLDAMVGARLLWLCGLSLAALNWANSAAQPWAVGFFVAAGVLTAFLLETKWCLRHGTTRQKFGQVLREVARDVWHAFDSNAKKSSGKIMDGD